MVTLVLGVALASTDGGVELEQRTREVMHTLVTIALPSSLPERELVYAEAFAVFDDIDRTLNEWRADSALSHVNAGAGGPGVDAPAQLCEVVQRSLEGARRTKGLFDPTWASVRGVWHFGTDADGGVPSARELEQACAAVGWKKVEVMPLPEPTPAAACRIRLTDPKTQLGLGGVVKGWGVDRVVRLLRARGLQHFAVQAGGDLYVAGAPRQVGLREPRGASDEIFGKLAVSDAAFSTSGDYEHFFLKNGVRYHHLLDPRTCRPAPASVAISVLAGSGTDAEFLTKAGFILGPRDGQALMKAWGAEAVWVTPEGRVVTTPGLGSRLQAHPPRGSYSAPRR
jgi:FAD:protein FMN transferase